MQKIIKTDLTRKIMKQRINLKPLFVERMKLLLGDKEFKEYELSLEKFPIKSIRANTLKISSEKLKKRLEEKKWIVKQPFKEFPEIMIIESNLLPGELGRTMEHLLGYYYVQEISSMMPVLVLNPKDNEKILDLCSSPGSKTTQIAAMINNTGVLIANDVKLRRIKILASNLERCGVTNSIITKERGERICRSLEKEDFKMDRILVDAPCSGEGTLRESPKTAKMWNVKRINTLSRIQKSLLEKAINALKTNGEIVYSTCTHGPEENEEVVDFILKNFDNVKIQKINLPKELKTREGLTEWKEKTYSKDLKKCARIYPHEDNCEGFFIAKMKKIK